MIKCLITRPNHDKVTSYLFQWSKEIINANINKEIQFLNLEGKEANKNNVENYLIKQIPKLVLFNGHGGDNFICGFKDEILIEGDFNEELLKEKIVYALSCSSARELGVKAVNKGTDTFIGYKNSFMIYTDSERETTPLKDNIAASFLAPSNRVSLSLLKGNSAQESSSKSKEEFKKEVKKYMVSNTFEGADRIAAALLWNANNQVVVGNPEAKIS